MVTWSLLPFAGNASLISLLVNVYRAVGEVNTVYAIYSDLRANNCLS